MHLSIERLLKVQEVDSEILFLREAKRARPQELGDEQRKLAQAQAAVEAVTGEIRLLRMDFDRKELEIKRCDAEIDKLSVALNTSRNNQAFSVLRDQIQRQKDSRSNYEEEALERLGQVEELERKRTRLQADTRDREGAVNRKRVEVEAVVAGLDLQLADLDARRSELVTGIDPQHLELYNRIFTRKGNTAMSAVRDGICQGCFMTVTNHAVTQLMLSREIVQCAHCVRLLYLDE